MRIYVISQWREGLVDDIYFTTKERAEEYMKEEYPKWASKDYSTKELFLQL